MPVQEIPREQWHGFFDSFSRQHEGWLATIELLEATSGAQRGALSFAGISLAGHDTESIVISLATSAVEHVTHMIDHPKRVWVQRTDEGANASLEIEAKDEARTLLRFRSPMLPELVDGIV